jgi:hypothetical protein
MMVVTLLGSIIGMMGGKITYGAGVGLVIVAGSIIVLSAIVTYMLSIILQI